MSGRRAQGAGEAPRTGGRRGSGGMRENASSSSSSSARGGLCSTVNQLVRRRLRPGMSSYRRML
eukprot:3527641-Pyramimonas_sp.AAC.1